MTPVQAILVVIIRLWAAKVIISFVANLPFYTSVIFSLKEAHDFLTITTMTNNAIWVVSGVAAWILAPKLARMVAPDTHDTAISINVNADTLVMIGGFLIGCFYLADYLPHLTYDISALFIQFVQQGQNSLHAQDTLYGDNFKMESFFKTLLVVIVAVWMIVMPQHIVRFFSWLRSAGQHTPEVSQSAGEKRE